MLGIHRQLLYSKMKRYGLDASEDRTQGVGKRTVRQARRNKKSKNYKPLFVGTRLAIQPSRAALEE